MPPAGRAKSKTQHQRRPDLEGRGAPPEQLKSHSVGRAFLIKRITSRNAESTENQVNQTVSRNHNEHPEESPEDFPLTLVTIGIGSLRGYELEDAPEEY